MSAMASQITGVSVICSTLCSGADQRKHLKSASLAFVRGIHRWPVNFPHKGQGWGQLHNINSNSNSGGFNSNSNSNSGQSPEYQLQLQLRRFQLQLRFQLRQISRISTPTPTPEVSTPIPTPEFQIQPQLHFKSNPSSSTKLQLPNYNVKNCTH